MRSKCETCNNCSLLQITKKWLRKDITAKCEKHNKNYYCVIVECSDYEKKEESK